MSLTRDTTYAPVWAGRLALLCVSIAALIGGVVVWSLSARSANLPALFPGPSIVWDELKRRLDDGTLLHDAMWSTGRLVIAFVAGSLLGAIVGVVAGASARLSCALMPLVTFFRFIPPIAWLGPALLWFGTGEASKAFILIYSCFFVVAVNVLHGVRTAPPDKHRVSQVYGLNRVEIIGLVLAPVALPAMFVGMRIALGNVFMSIVLAEMLGAREGLGTVINTGMIVANPAQIFVGIAAIGALGLLADWLFRWLGNRLNLRFEVAL